MYSLKIQWNLLIWRTESLTIANNNCIYCLGYLLVSSISKQSRLKHPNPQVQSLLERFWEQLLQMSRNHLTSCQSGNLESLFMILVTTVERVRQLCSSKSPEVAKEASAAYTLLEKLWDWGCVSVCRCSARRLCFATRVRLRLGETRRRGNDKFLTPVVGEGLKQVCQDNKILGGL